MQALIDIVETDRRARVDAILGTARDRASALLLDAHRDARSRVRAAFAEERRLRDVRVSAARANFQTKRRLVAQQRATALLASAWSLLPDALLLRWGTTESRRAWVASIVSQARDLLVPTQTTAVTPSHDVARWTIDHATDWPDAERDALATQFQQTLHTTPEFRADPTIRAGLRIARAGTVVDGTLEALVRDRASNAPRLLGYLQDDFAER